MRSLVQDVVPTFAHSASPSGHPSVAARAARAVPPKRSGAWSRGCAQAKATGAFSFGQVRHAYGIDRLGRGSGASVAILNLGEGVSRQDIADNARCFGYPRLHVRTLLTDGQTHAFGQGTFEPEEDLALVRGMAPGLNSLTFTQAWLSPQLWFLGASQVLDALHLPDSFSISYGECERSTRGERSTATTRAGANVASQFPGWPVVLAGNWITDAGTSGSAPLVASAMAMLSSDEQRRHLPPVGPADGLFYFMAKSAPSTFWDVVSGANGYLRKVRARHAERGYDLASGLGVPQFARLAAALPAPAPAP
jgi:hypothetical protein